MAIKKPEFTRTQLPIPEREDTTTGARVPYQVGEFRPSAKPGLAQKKSKDQSQVFGIILLGAALFLVGAIFFQGPGSRGPASKKVELQKIDGLVNRHLIMTNKKIELEQEKARLEHEMSAPSVGDMIIPKSRPNALYGVDHSPDRNELNAVRDLQRTPDLNLVSPDSIIQSELADKDAKGLSEKIYKEEYARQFIANARAAGYDIELDENFVVKKVKPLNRSPQRGLFDSSSH